MKNIFFKMIVVAGFLALTVSPLWAGDALADLFSQTRICYSQIAVSKGWETEIAVINPTNKKISGKFYFYDMQGGQLGSPYPVTLNPHGRWQAEVGKTFANRGNIEYMVFKAPTYGIKGYSKFYFAGIRASIMASAPQTSGLFTKIDHEGWTGIAFVNTSAAEAHVILTAYDDSGNARAVVPLTVKAGEKIVKTAEKLFSSQSIAEATYIEFTSDQGIVGFFLNGSKGNLMLDGSKAL